jgi:hypothetical protein
MSTVPFAESLPRWRARVARVSAGLLVGLGATASHADSIRDLQGEIRRATENVVVSGVDILGDRVNLYNGALEFSQTDIACLAKKLDRN